MSSSRSIENIPIESNASPTPATTQDQVSKSIVSNGHKPRMFDHSKHENDERNGKQPAHIKTSGKPPRTPSSNT